MLKKVLHIVLFLSMACGGMETLHAQHYIGVKGGFGGGTSRFFPKEEMGTVWGLYSGGISWKYYSYERYLGGVEADLLFMQQGYRHYTLLDNLPGDTTTYMEREINSFVLPIFWQPHFYFFQRKVRLYLNLGVTFSYNMNSQYKWYSAEKGLLEDLPHGTHPRQPLGIRTGGRGRYRYVIRTCGGRCRRTILFRLLRYPEKP